MKEFFQITTMLSAVVIASLAVFHFPASDTEKLSLFSAAPKVLVLPLEHPQTLRN